jgi:hypothetical protein
MNRARVQNPMLMEVKRRAAERETAERKEKDCVSNARYK